MLIFFCLIFFEEKFPFKNSIETEFFEAFNKANAIIANSEMMKKALSKFSKKNIVVPKQGLAEGTLFIEINQAALKGDKDKLEIGVYTKGKLIETAKSSFLGPRSYK